MLQQSRSKYLLIQQGSGKGLFTHEFRKLQHVAFGPLQVPPVLYLQWLGITKHEIIFVGERAPTIADLLKNHMRLQSQNLVSPGLAVVILPNT